MIAYAAAIAKRHFKSDDAGYSDQPHMCREIRDLTGSSPQALIKNSNAFSTMSEMFNTAYETPTNNGNR